jgi:hypothetical protein
VGSSLNQRTAEFSLCNTLVLLLDLSFKQFRHWPISDGSEWTPHRVVSPGVALESLTDAELSACPSGSNPE